MNLIETPYERVGRLQRERKAAREAAQRKPVRKSRKPIEPNWRRIADHIDGYDRDDLGESPDY